MPSILICLCISGDKRTSSPSLFSITVHPAQRFLHIKRIPQYYRVSDQTSCTQLIFHPFTIALSDLTALPITDCPRYNMSTFSPVELRQDPPTINFIINIIEKVQCFVDAPTSIKLSDPTVETKPRRWLLQFLQAADDQGGIFWFNPQ